MKQAPEDLRTWVEIDTKAILHNYRVFRKLIGKNVKLLAVVKSNAYGHNLIEFGKTLEKLGVDMLGVDSLVEGLALRNAGVKKPILVLGFTLPVLYGVARTHDIALTISSLPQLKEICSLQSSKKPLAIHIKVDTGMHRQGFQHEEGNILLEMIARTSPRVVVVDGLYTHFAEAKNPRNSDTTKRQIGVFETWRELFREAGHNPICHAGATGGALLYPGAHYDMVRIGIGMYGLWPSPEAERALSHRIHLRPVLSWRAVVAEVKQVKKGERVGYDFTEMLTRDTTLAVIPIGYWHGFPRMLSSRGRVLIHKKTARVLGRVSMDMIVVDVTDIPFVKAGDVATIIGKDGREEIRASELALYSGTTHYEIVTRLNPLMKKIYR